MIELRNGFLIIALYTINKLYHNILVTSQNDQLYKVVKTAPNSIFIEGDIVIVDPRDIIKINVLENQFLIINEEKILGVYHE